MEMKDPVRPTPAELEGRRWGQREEGERKVHWREMRYVGTDQ